MTNCEPFIYPPIFLSVIDMSRVFVMSCLCNVLRVCILLCVCNVLHACDLSCSFSLSRVCDVLRVCD